MEAIFGPTFKWYCPRALAIPVLTTAGGSHRVVLCHRRDVMRHYPLRAQRELSPSRPSGSETALDVSSFQRLFAPAKRANASFWDLEGMGFWEYQYKSNQAAFESLRNSFVPRGVTYQNQFDID